MVGMMGIGFSVGFAQSHFELGAILGLMVLCYGFARLPPNSISTRFRNTWSAGRANRGDTRSSCG
jgi:hypothetical protein